VAELKEAKDALRKRLTDKRLVMVPGLREDLAAILGGFEDLERRTGVLAAFLANLATDPESGLLPAEVAAIAAMSDHARARLRAWSHGARCTCADCMREIRT